MLRRKREGGRERRRGKRPSEVSREADMLERCTGSLVGLLDGQTDSKGGHCLAFHLGSIGDSIPESALGRFCSQNICTNSPKVPTPPHSHSLFSGGNRPRGRWSCSRLHCGLWVSRTQISVLPGPVLGSYSDCPKPWCLSTPQVSSSVK